MTDDSDPMELQPMALADVAENPLTPSTLGQAMQLANMLAKSSLVPEAMQGKPVNVLMALMKGAEVGMTPVQTLSSVFVVDGKAEFYGKGMLAIVMQHPDYYDRKEWFTDNEGNVVEHQAHCAHCIMYRVRRDGSLATFSAVFSLEEAHQAELDGKRNWRKSPDRMLMWRARSIAADSGFPDALRGLAARPDQSAADFAAVELRPAISEAFEAHGIKPPQADEPLTITCNCVDGAGFPQHDCKTCEGSGEYIDPRTDGSAPVPPMTFRPLTRTEQLARIDPLKVAGEVIPVPKGMRPAPEPEDDQPIELPDSPSLCDNCDEPFAPDAESVTTCSGCTAELNAPFDAGPAPPALECPVCEGETTRFQPGMHGTSTPLSCDDCNNRAAKG